MSAERRAMGRRWLSISVIASCFVILTASSYKAEDMGTNTGVKVTILLYSGRPDPTFTIEDTGTIDQLKTLIGRAKATAKFEGRTVIPSILGYKGIRVDNRAKVPGVPASFAVYKGNMEVMDGDKRFLIDEGSVVEQFLLAAAVEKKVITDEVLRYTRSEK